MYIGCLFFKAMFSCVGSNFKKITLINISPYNHTKTSLTVTEVTGKISVLLFSCKNNFCVWF